MTRTPRSATIARLFSDGATIGELAFKFLVRTDVIESAIRRQLNKARKR